ncbi:hypothetical protein [Sulfurovum mangrovi]|uniref:hypothetical protein n=1 Tax=Sulfurovum mangrovi TaxID=2893889 RepID=UPI001E5A2680|nr:hypothetical protein [Sulfurovum mangrovi]UFH58774.1 hypothetical protein LN246_10530 [Sulfurovum mangrovi]
MFRTLILSLLTLTLAMSEELLTGFTLSDQHFMIKTESYHIYDSKGKVLRLYQERGDGEAAELLSFTLDDTTGACHERSIEEGSYEINGSMITFYTRWDRRGNSDAPYGARIKRYTVDGNGALKLLSSKIYIETERKSEMQESAMQYLFKAPVTENEKEALRDYIENTEKRFKGTFVFGKEAESLINEVKAALHRKSQSVWH